ncbi:MAG TPA: response regulator [Candidatus Deferrimicrobium sp.]|nr:response regulator [Candidatus Kapabacteria bacterium]HLP58188.1 response regulator [Candidatus Deferrimicrobium sp.]
MPNILIVDDDETFVLSLTEGLFSHNPDFKIFAARNGKEAIKTLNSRVIDLVVTDIKMPEMDGFELVAYISQYYKDISIIVITAFGTPEIEKNLKEIGSFQYLEKPLDINDLEEKIIEGLKKTATGYAKGVSLTAFVQMIALERETCTLNIKSNEKNGYLYFQNGVLINAEYDNKKGEEASNEIFVWENVEIEIEKKCKKTITTIETPLNYLLIEAYRRKDELKKQHYDLENEISKNQNLKEKKMDIKKLQEAVKMLKEDLGEGLLSTDIYTNVDGQSIAGYNTLPKACALFNRMTFQLNRTLKDSGFPVVGKYYMLDLADKKRVFVIPLGDYQWGILVDGSIALGLLLNIAIPKAIDAFEQAITG